MLGSEIGGMMRYIGEVEGRAFENTSGLPEVGAGELGIVTACGGAGGEGEEELVSARRFYEELDCGKLFWDVEHDVRRLGTAER